MEVFSFFVLLLASKLQQNHLKFYILLNFHTLVNLMISNKKIVFFFLNLWLIQNDLMYDNFLIIIFCKWIIFEFAEGNSL